MSSTISTTVDLQRARLTDLLSEPEWLIEQDSDDPAQAGFFESLFALTNGLLGLRATLDFESETERPGCYLADVYARGIDVSREIVNLPNPLPFRVRVAGEPLRPQRGAPFRRALDLQTAAVFYELIVADEQGLHPVRVQSLLVLDPGRPSGLVVVDMEPLGWAGSIDLETSTDWRRGNSYLGRDQMVGWHHAAVDDVDGEGGGLVVEARIHGGERRIAVVSGIMGLPRSSRWSVRREFRKASIVTSAAMTPGEPLRIGKFFALASSPAGDRDSARDIALAELGRAMSRGIAGFVARHRRYWRASWMRHDVRIDGDRSLQQAIRYGIFELQQHRNPVRPQPNVPARGLTSEYHSGHFFFNTELYLLPYWCWVKPEVARRYLDFRYDTLAEARVFARSTGFTGARFPEATDDLGEEAGPAFVRDWATGETSTEWSVREVMHLSADVAYALDWYWSMSGDTEYMWRRGLELLAETARFGLSILARDPASGGFTVENVMGPDEYHFHVRSSFFTNEIVRWNLRFASQAWQRFEADDPRRHATLAARLGIRPIELSDWEKVARLIVRADVSADGVVEQHEGYFALPDCGLRTGDADIDRLSADERTMAGSLESFPTQLIKQADVIMLASMFPAALDVETTRAAFDYYEPRTAHESSLSAGPHGLVAARLGDAKIAEHFLRRCFRFNLDFRPREHYSNGVHLASFAAGWRILVEGLADIRRDQDPVQARPLLPGGIRRLAFTIKRGRALLRIDVTDVVRVSHWASGGWIPHKGPSEADETGASHADQRGNWA
jgi:kojibiose phosphorylase